MSSIPPLPVPFNSTTYWIWSHEGISEPRPEAKGPFRTRLFRRTFEAPKGARLAVHVSADTQYRLWCNGQEVSYGPAKGDVEHQFYETVDLAPLLKAGRNVLAAQVVYVGDVWAEGAQSAPISRMTAAPGFVLWGVLENAAGKEIELLHSDAKWRVWIDLSCVHQDSTDVARWLGATEEVFCDRRPWGFQQVDFDDSAWETARTTELATTPAHRLYIMMPHRLVPRMTALLEVSEERDFADVIAGGTETQRAAFRAILRGEGGLPVRVSPLRAEGILPSIASSSAAAGRGRKTKEAEEKDRRKGRGRDAHGTQGRDALATTLPAGSAVKFIVKVPTLTTGYPVIRFSGGAGATIRLRYAEALTQPGGLKKHRDDPSGELVGYADIIHPDGPERTYQPFPWRTFRFVGVEIETGAEPLTIHSLRYKFSAYPFVELAKFESSDASHAGVWDLCWRTARLCAHETYEDCPYYEQLQYGGDTQVQAMISYYVPADASLARQWLYQFDWSRTSDGLTRSRYPSRVPQVIPFWSLHWVQAVKDYWEHTGDRAALADLLPGVRAVMGYFQRRVTGQGIVGRITGWQCADWCPQWGPDKDGQGVPPGCHSGQSAFVSLMTAVTLDQAADLAEAAGECGGDFRRESAQIKLAVHRLFFGTKRGLYRDMLSGDLASAYTNVWAILADMPCDLPALAERIITDRKLCQLTMFSTYFAYRALAKAGRYDLAPELLKPWPAMREYGLTTCPEIPSLSHTRSDCHAWSAGPLVEFCREILGVRPAAPGYASVRIEPHPAGLKFARGRVPITRADGSSQPRFVEVDWRIEGGRFVLSADAPKGVPCEVKLPGGAAKVFADGGRIRLESGAK